MRRRWLTAGLLVFLLGATCRPTVAGENPPPAQPLAWKMVWVWAMGNRPATQTIALAKSLGFNAVTSGDVAACRAMGMQAVGVVYMSDAPVSNRQELLPAE